MGGICMWIGVVLFLSGFPLQWYLKKRAKGILAWPVAHGVVVEAGLKSYTVGGSQSSQTNTMFMITYDYTVGGQTYHGQTSPGGGTVAELQARMVKGAPIEVQYNPQHPEKSHVGFTGKGLSLAILPWIFGLTTIAIGAMMWHGEHARH